MKLLLPENVSGVITNPQTEICRHLLPFLCVYALFPLRFMKHLFQIAPLPLLSETEILEMINHAGGHPLIKWSPLCPPNSPSPLTSSLGLIVNRSWLLSDLVWWWSRLSAVPPLHLSFPSFLFVVTVSKCCAKGLSEIWDPSDLRELARSWSIQLMPDILTVFQKGRRLLK